MFSDRSRVATLMMSMAGTVGACGRRDQRVKRRRVDVAMLEIEGEHIHARVRSNLHFTDTGHSTENGRDRIAVGHPSSQPPNR
jgi:hypothetical protein